MNGRRYFGGRRGGGKPDALISAMSGLSVRDHTSRSTIRVPAISAFTLGEKTVAGDNVYASEAVPVARPIPTNYASTSEYLKVRAYSPWQYLLILA